MSLKINQSLSSSEILYVSFNQDYGCFACGTINGFKIFNIVPFSEIFRRNFVSGGIGIIEMLYRCNIVALVGGGNVPKFPPNTVMIWDDHKLRCIAEIKFASNVCAVKLRRDRIVVVLENKIYVYNLSDVRLLDTINTAPNPEGIIALCPLYDIKKSAVINAHSSPLQCIALSTDGTRIASASIKGTIIRIFDTETGLLLEELRRGKEKATMYSMAFSQHGDYLACTSSRNTLHIYKLKESSVRNQDINDIKNEKNKFSFSKLMTSNICKYSFTEPGKFICAFSSDDSCVVVLTSKGNLYHITYKDNKCECLYSSKFIDDTDNISSLVQ
ncbi:hypothetical protein WA158_003638 [Blastocystis sp. Blastoise]